MIPGSVITLLPLDGIRMHYVEEGQGPLVILLHGYPFLWYLRRHQIKALRLAGQLP